MFDTICMERTWIRKRSVNLEKGVRRCIAEADILSMWVRRLKDSSVNCN